MMLFNKFHVLIIPHILCLRWIQCYPIPFTAHRHLYNRLTKNRWGPLFGGIGTAKDYSWREEQFEIELKIPVPVETKQSDVVFKANIQSIQLSLRTKNGTVDLVDRRRETRGRIDIDGTFWSFSELERTDVDFTDKANQKFITVHIEKMISSSSSSSDQFDAVVEYDWNGIFRDDDTEVISKKYKEPEVLNIREYAASLGVDIDHIDMSKVDKNMFTSGLNMTRSSLDELCKVGYAKEVTRQSDGNEFIVDENSGESIPFDFLGNGVGRDEIDKVMDEKTGTISQATAPNAMGKGRKSENLAMNDPIDLLPSNKLRDILNAEGITTKDAANDDELRTTLKKHIQGKLSKRKNPKENRINPVNDNK